ncbi:MBL fold metallo-hydrolase RNA specificity domain-containing protein [Hydrogenimonas sp.]
MMAVAQSFGAAQVVTGSCHMLKIEKGPRILVDCGMFQGNDEEARNYDPFGFNPKKVDILLVTHAHLDHVGRIPKLVKEGFDGTIVATKPTMELARIVMLDAARLMEEEYRTLYRKAQRRGEEKKVRKPLYTTEDVEEVFLRVHLYAKYDMPIRLAKGVKATFRDAGHILGSATVQIDFKEKNRRKSVLYSGDLGNKNDIVMKRIEPVERADTLFIESTYGDRNHKSMEETIREFKDAVIATLHRGGNVLIPSFAIERTQEILCILKQMYLKKELPRCKIFVDSPMAVKATHIFSKYHNQLSPLCNRFYKEDGDIFGFSRVRFVTRVEDSKKINKIEHGAIIIAGNGMCNGGRILHHFKNRIWNPKNSVLIVGFQAKGTLGRQIVDGAKWITIYGEKIKIAARIYTINGFSAHADQRGLIRWIRDIDGLKSIFVVHGEPDKQWVFKKVLKRKVGKKAHIVKFGEKLYI